MIAFDCETENNEKDKSCRTLIINFFNGVEHTTFTGEDCKNKARDFILNSKEKIFFAHEAEYDINALFYPLWLDELELFYNGRLIFARIKGTKKLIYDTVNFSFTSIKNIGKVLGLEKIDVQGDFNNVEYCRRDTEICYHYFKEFYSACQKEFKLSPKKTLAGTAQTIFLKRFDRNRLGGMNTEPELLNAYFGGRCECFKVGETENYTFEIDINSSYPNVMKNRLYPITEYRRSIVPSGKMYITDAIVEINDCEFPVLPVKKDKLYFPTGKFRGWFTSPELELAQQLGQVKSIQYISSFNFDTLGNPFEEFIDYFYNKRLEAKKEGNEFYSTFYKLIMNSTYGRFALNGGMESIGSHEFNPGESAKYTELEYFEDENVSRFKVEFEQSMSKNINYALPVFITAYARLDLYSMIQDVIKCGGIPLYGDTDSCYFTFNEKIDLQDKIVELHEKLRIGNKLGERSMAAYAYMQVKNLKQYVCIDLAKFEKYRCKGVPLGYRKQYFEQGMTTYKRPQKLRPALRKVLDMKANYWYDFNIFMRGNYTKRVVIKGDGCLLDTKPVKISEE